MSTTVKLEALLDAFDWLSMTEFASAAWVSRTTGSVYWVPESDDALEEDLPDDLGSPAAYVAVPHKKDLDLGQRLVMRFVEQVLPASYETVERIFSKRGAYGQFKALLERSGKLDAWYQYEQEATEQALREWAEDNGFRVE